MKTKESFRKAETLEDIVFEGRNKLYGAFDLQRKERKYLIIAFLICFTGVSTAVTVPFIHSLKNPPPPVPIDKNVPVIISDVNQDKPDLPLPEPDLPDQMTDKLTYKIPEIKENADSTLVLMPTTEAIAIIENPVIDKIITVVTSDKEIIPEPEETIVFSPSEPAYFMGCSDLKCFHQWVSENIKYPELAAQSEIFGKVIVQFCVNSKGEVVDVKLLRKLDPAIDEETVKLIKSSPKWTPAKQGGNPVKTLFTISFTFKLV